MKTQYTETQDTREKKQTQKMTKTQYINNTIHSKKNHSTLKSNSAQNTRYTNKQTNKQKRLEGCYI